MVKDLEELEELEKLLDTLIADKAAEEDAANNAQEDAANMSVRN